MRYQVVPLVYAVGSICAFAAVCRLEWIPSAFMTWGRDGSTKFFFGAPIESEAQYNGLIALSFVNAFLNTFFRELMDPFWYAVVGSDPEVRRQALRRGMSNSRAALLLANVEAEVYLKFAHLLSLFFSLVDIWAVLAQLLGSTAGSTAVIVWYHRGS